MQQIKIYLLDDNLVTTLFYNDERDERVQPEMIDSFTRIDTVICSLVLPKASLPQHSLSLVEALMLDSELVKLAHDYSSPSTIPLVDLVLLPSGTYRMALRDRRSVQELYDEWTQGSDALFCEVLDYHLCNGWKFVRNGLDCWAGFNDLLLLSNDVQEDKEFLVYSYRNSWIYNPIEKLLEEGYIDLEPSSARPLQSDPEEQRQQEEYEHINE